MSYIIQKTHKDRYRKIYCDEKFYNQHQNIFKMWKTRFAQLSDMEKLLAWVIALSCLRRPKDWYGGKRQNIFLNDTSAFQHSLTLKQVFSETPILIPPQLDEDMNLIDFINIIKIKAFPESCHRSLCFSANLHYPLIISEKIPKPEELLHLQIRGQRIVSFNENYHAWPQILHGGRDFLSFVMHDLIHADHFFYNPEHRDGQLGFFKFIENILPDKSLAILLHSETFKTGFEYIISDMNSHPVHLFQTLKTLLFSEVKNDTEATLHWSNWIQHSGLTAEESRFVRSINTPDFDDFIALGIEILCIRLGKQHSV